MLDSEVPLHGIGVLRIGVHVPEHLVERSRRGEEPLGKGIRTGFVRQYRLAQLVVDVVVELLRDVGPAPFIVLGCLGDARPVVEKHAEGGAQRCLVLQPVGKTDARLPVVRGVVVDLAARLRQHMLRKGAVGSRNARRPLPHGARRRDLLDEIDATLQVVGAGLDPTVFPFRSRGPVGRLEGAVVAEPEVDREARRHPPLVVEVKPHDAAPAHGLVDVPASGGVRQIQQERRELAPGPRRERGIGGLWRAEPDVRVVIERFEVVAVQLAAPTESVVAGHSRHVRLHLVDVGHVGLQGIGLAAAEKVSDIDGREQDSPCELEVAREGVGKPYLLVEIRGNVAKAGELIDSHVHAAVLDL